MGTIGFTEAALDLYARLEQYRGSWVCIPKSKKWLNALMRLELLIPDEVVIKRRPKPEPTSAMLKAL